MSRYRSPLAWYGGKYYLRNWLLSYVPKGYRLYCEVFGGAAHLLFSMDHDPGVVEVYNDVYADLSNFFAVLRDKEKCDRLVEMVELTEYGCPIFREAKARLVSQDYRDDVERAWLFFIVNAQSKFALGERFCRTRGVHCSRGVLPSLKKWNSRLNRLGLAHERVRNLIVECMDFRRFIEFYDSPSTFFYCDPPYVIESRQRKRAAYTYEMSLQDYQDLVQLLLQVRGKVLLSGYRHEVYAPLERAGWRVAETVVHSPSALEAGSKQPLRTEVVWYNYDPPSMDDVRGASQPQLDGIDLWDR